MVDPYASGVLRKGFHERLVANLDNYAQAAGIERHWVWTSMHGVCTEAEIDWTLNFRFHKAEGRPGMVVVGEDFPAEDHFSAIAGCLLRNFTRARVLSLNELLAAAQDDDVPDDTCLLVPNFFVGVTPGKGGLTWRNALLADILTARKLTGLLTVVYVSNFAQMREAYGAGVARILTTYKTVEFKS